MVTSCGPRAKHGFQSFGTGKPRIEDRHGVDPAIANADKAGAHIDAIQSERFHNRLDAHPLNFCGEPLAGLPVDFSSRAMIALRVVRFNDACDALLDRRKRGRSLGLAKVGGFRDAGAHA
jgi:hypothetical protein